MTPPNHRHYDDWRCYECLHFVGNKCTLYNTETKRFDVCDAFEIAYDDMANDLRIEK